MNEKLSIQVLAAAVSQKDYSLLDKMNIQSDAVVGNQFTDSESRYTDCVKNFVKNGHCIKWLNFHEKGVGLNRNNTWMRSSADVVIFADDDMVFLDGYPQTIRKLYHDHPEADVIILNLPDEKGNRNEIKRFRRTKKTGYGAARITCRRERLQEKGINFNLCFGGGAKYSHGEDFLFLADCLNKGCKIYLAPVHIAVLKSERESTWFHGYNDKYFYDKGVLLAVSRIRFLHVHAMVMAFRLSRERLVNKSFGEIAALILKGIAHIQNQDS